MGLILGAIMVGGGLGGFIDVPSVIIVVGGTFAVAFVMFPLKIVLSAIKVGMKTLVAKPPDNVENIQQLMLLADKARKESLVALEKVAIEDPFLKRGVQLVADGTEEGVVRGGAGS